MDRNRVNLTESGGEVEFSVSSFTQIWVRGYTTGADWCPPHLSFVAWKITATSACSAATRLSWVEWWHTPSSLTCSMLTLTNWSTCMRTKLPIDVRCIDRWNLGYAVLTRDYPGKKRGGLFIFGLNFHPLSSAIIRFMADGRCDTFTEILCGSRPRRAAGICDVCICRGAFRSFVNSIV
jgi:hypothetical protein